MDEKAFAACEIKTVCLANANNIENRYQYNICSSHCQGGGLFYFPGMKEMHEIPEDSLFKGIDA